MRFLHPEAAIWLLAVPAAWTAWLLHRWYRDQTRRVSGFGPRLATISRTAGVGHDLAVLLLGTVAMLGLVFAAARPQVVVRTAETERLDLIVVLDRSVSMHAEDVRPTRFRRASLELRNFLRTKPDTISRVGLIGFAGTSLVLSHLTQDPDILFFYLDAVEEEREPRFGTDVAGALESAMKLAARDQPARRKLIVLISDGDDHSARLDRALAALQAQRIPVYTIGVGGDAEVDIPAVGDDASHGLLRDDRGAVLTTRFSENTLRRVAGATGGRYFRSVTGGELATALDEIAARERRIAQWRERYRDAHVAGLAAAAVALASLLVLA